MLKYSIITVCKCRHPIFSLSHLWHFVFTYNIQQLVVCFVLDDLEKSVAHYCANHSRQSKTFLKTLFDKMSVYVCKWQQSDVSMGWRECCVRLLLWSFIWRPHILPMILLKLWKASFLSTHNIQTMGHNGMSMLIGTLQSIIIKRCYIFCIGV